MRRVIYFLSTIVFLFTISSPIANALTTPSGDLVVSSTDSDPQPTSQPSMSPEPSEIPSQSPSPTPNTTVEPTSTPTDLVSEPTPTEAIIASIGGPKDIPAKRDDKKIENTQQPTSTATLRSVATTVTQNTSKKTITKSPQNNIKSSVEKLKETIIPPSNNLVKINGVNHYREERLPRDTTIALLLLSLFLFITGISILKIPGIVRSITLARERNRGLRREPFVIPYFGL